MSQSQAGSGNNPYPSHQAYQTNCEENPNFLYLREQPKPCMSMSMSMRRCGRRRRMPRRSLRLQTLFDLFDDITSHNTKREASIRRITPFYQSHTIKTMRFTTVTFDALQILSATSIVANNDSSIFVSDAINRQRQHRPIRKGKGKGYEVWGSDQSNSVAGETSSGVRGGFLWIWDSESIEDQLDGKADATPLNCTPCETEGPCNLLDIFPQDLLEVGTDTPLSSLTGLVVSMELSRIRQVFMLT